MNGGGGGATSIHSADGALEGGGPNNANGTANGGVPANVQSGGALGKGKSKPTPRQMMASYQMASFTGPGLQESFKSAMSSNLSQGSGSNRSAPGVVPGVGGPGGGLGLGGAGNGGWYGRGGGAGAMGGQGGPSRRDLMMGYRTESQRLFGNSTMSRGTAADDESSVGMGTVGHRGPANNGGRGRGGRGGGGGRGAGGMRTGRGRGGVHGSFNSRGSAELRASGEFLCA